MRDEKSATDEEFAEEARKWDEGEKKPTDPGWEDAPDAVPNMGAIKRVMGRVHLMLELGSRIASIAIETGGFPTRRMLELQEKKDKLWCQMTKPERDFINELGPYSVAAEDVAADKVIGCIEDLLRGEDENEVDNIKVVRRNGEEDVFFIIHDYDGCHRALPGGVDCEMCGRLIMEGALCRIFSVEAEKFSGRARVCTCPRCAETWVKKIEKETPTSMSAKTETPRLGMEKLCRAIGAHLHYLSDVFTFEGLAQVFELAVKDLKDEGVVAVYQHADMIGAEFEDGTREEYSQQQIILEMDFGKGKTHLGNSTINAEAPDLKDVIEANSIKEPGCVGSRLRRGLVMLNAIGRILSPDGDPTIGGYLQATKEAFDYAAKELGAKSIEQVANTYIIIYDDGSKDSLSDKELMILWDASIREKTDG